MDPRLPQVRALSVAGDTIAGGVDVREGTTDTVGHERIDLDGRCVLPGVLRRPRPLPRLGARPRPSSTCAAAASMAEALADRGRRGRRRVAARARVARGRRGPTGRRPSEALDAVTGDRPIALWAHDHHTLWVNSAALGAAGADGLRDRARARRLGLPAAGANAARAVAGSALGDGGGERARRRRGARLSARSRARPVAAARRRPAPHASRAHVVPGRADRGGAGDRAPHRLRLRPPAGGAGEGVHGRHARIVDGVDARRLGDGR